MSPSARLGPQPHVTEKAVEHWCIDAFKKAGCVVMKLSQPRNSMQSVGLADLYVLVPRRRTAFWFEVKSPTGRQSEAQRAFQASCEASGVRYVMGGIEEARGVLAELGLTWQPGP